jgi:hypothetical protein
LSCSALQAPPKQAAQKEKSFLPLFSTHERYWLGKNDKHTENKPKKQKTQVTHHKNVIFCIFALVINGRYQPILAWKRKKIFPFFPHTNDIGFEETTNTPKTSLKKQKRR